MNFPVDRTRNLVVDLMHLDVAEGPQHSPTRRTPDRANSPSTEGPKEGKIGIAVIQLVM